MSGNVNFLGFGTKGGANYNLDDTNNVFVNVGYFSRAPFLTGGVFVNKESVDFNEDAANEKIFSAEIGYGFRSEKFNANVNLYRTSWLDKAISPSVRGDAPGEFLNTNITGLDALHQGIEVDFVYQLSDKLKINGMASIGDWKWKSDIEADIFNEDGTLNSTVQIFATDLKVNDAAQTTYALGLNYKALDKTSISLDYNYAGDIYARFDFSDGTTDRQNTWKMPSYHLFDLGINHGFSIGEFDATLTGNMNNIFDVEYISDAFDATSHSATDADVYYGAGRTFSLGLKVNF